MKRIVIVSFILFLISLVMILTALTLMNTLGKQFYQEVILVLSVPTCMITAFITFPPLLSTYIVYGDK